MGNTNISVNQILVLFLYHAQLIYSKYYRLYQLEMKVFANAVYKAVLNDTYVCQTFGLYLLL